ncbi:MAG: UDP-diphosphatase [Candidatus Pelagibacter sp.]|nr:UDP-diphosphatase [Candidatus Pelagibacter sp.]|tara:strand:+ start:7675 stop:8433 length:759 start_codon:yes stop_codon:yes gene_type:complete
MIEILILSIIQGITEFLPISSSSHLIIISKYLNFENQGLSLDVSLHIGSFIAVITYFREDIFSFVKNKDLFIKIIISSIPVMIVGFLLVKYNLVEQLRNVEVIGWTTIIFGIVLYISDKYNLDKKIETDFNFKSALFIGIFQILSLIPGVSRSGITISAARMLKFNRVDSAKISFLLSIPTLIAVSLFGIKNLITYENLAVSNFNLISILFSFLFSYITIKFFLRYIKNFNLNLFVIYRVILGLVLLTIAYL